MYLYCIVIIILYCPPKDVFLYSNFQLGPRKSVRCKEVSDKNCPLHKGFLVRILYETNSFLKRVSARRRVRLEDVRYKEVSLKCKYTRWFNLKVYSCFDRCMRASFCIYFVSSDWDTHAQNSYVCVRGKQNLARSYPTFKKLRPNFPGRTKRDNNRTVGKKQ